MFRLFPTEARLGSHVCECGGKLGADKYYRIAHNVSSRKRVDIIARAKQLGVKVTNAKAKVTTEV